MIKDSWRQDFQSQGLLTSALSSCFRQEEGWYCFQFQLNVPTAQVRIHRVAPTAGALHHSLHEPESPCSLKTNGSSHSFMITSSGPFRNWAWNHDFSTMSATGRPQDILSVSQPLLVSCLSIYQIRCPRGRIVLV